MGQSDTLLTYQSTTNINPVLQSASLSEHNNDTGGYCNYTNTENLNWQNVPNDDFVYATSSYFNDGDNTNNIPGLLPDTNENFVSGELKESNSSMSKISLGRSQFTEIEYALKATNDAKGSYCFRVVDGDPNNDNQTSKYPNMILGYFNSDYQKINLVQDNFYIPVTIGGVIIDKNELLLKETAYQSTYNIKLSSQPTDTVNIHIATNDSRIKFLLPNQSQVDYLDISFNGSNWNTNQTISVFVPKTPDIEGTTYGSIHHTSTSNDPAYNYLVIKPIQTTVTDTNEATSNIQVKICGTGGFIPPSNFSFPDITVGEKNLVYSPNLEIQLFDDRCGGGFYSLMMQATEFCHENNNSMCIPLNNIYLATSNLVNEFATTLTPAQIKDFTANYLQTGININSEEAFKHIDPNDDINISVPNVLIDINGVYGDDSHFLSGSLEFLLHLMIDYPNINDTLGVGEYTTTLIFDFILNTIPG